MLVTIKLSILLIMLISCFAIGAVLSGMTDGFTNLDGLFEDVYEETIEEEKMLQLDNIYDNVLLLEGYYRHGKITREEYLTRLHILQKEVTKFEQENSLR